MGSLESSLAELTVRAHAWDSFEHHISAWNSQLNSLDQKLELMSRTQDGRLTEQGNRMKLIPDIDFKLDGLGRKLGELGGQVQVGHSLPIHWDQKPNAISRSWTVGCLTCRTD